MSKRTDNLCQGYRTATTKSARVLERWERSIVRDTLARTLVMLAGVDATRAQLDDLHKADTWRRGWQAKMVATTDCNVSTRKG